jgi:hypothetical protein
MRFKVLTMDNSKIIEIWKVTLRNLADRFQSSNTVNLNTIPVLAFSTNS